MQDIITALICIFVTFSIFLLLWFRRRHDYNNRQREEPQPPQVERVIRGGGARRMRRRTAGGAGPSTSTPTEVEDESEEEEIEEDNNNARGSSKKEKKRQEREAQRQAEVAARESRQTKQDRYADMRRRKDEERDALERKQEEEERIKKEKEEEKAALEFETWRGEFSVDSEGTTQNELHDDDSQGLVHNFVEYIKKQKCVQLEELAGEFNLRTQDCINRIISLENIGRLSGVMDDRGKYIYISEEEMQAVADYIKRKGRVSISHLASQSNQFIDLEPKLGFSDNDGSSPVEPISVP